MVKKRILWVDDEISSLKPHILFLEKKGFEVVQAVSGDDAIELVRREQLDLVLLDEMMPGKGGLATLEEIKDINPHLPVVMVTKSEEESLMEDAIGQKIDDYLTKPVNPSQVLMVAKRILDSKKIVSESMMKRYIADINKFNQKLYGAIEPDDWKEAAQIIAKWDIELDNSIDEGLMQIHLGTRKEWNIEFTKYLERNYVNWMKSDDRPVMSPDILDKYLTPLLKTDNKVLFLVVDCMRLDQWLTVEPLIAEFYNINLSSYYSILPSATPFARNSLFAGMFPDQIAERHPKLYNEGNEGSLNRDEDRLFAEYLEDKKIKITGGMRYEKVFNNTEGEVLAKRAGDFFQSNLVAFVFNFLDILSHGRSSNVILKEIAGSESAFRSLMKSWFSHSPLFTIMKTFAERGYTLVVTSDHGSVLCSRGTMAHGKRDTSTNLRYKYGDNLNSDPKESWLIKKPAEYHLPSFSLATTYLIAKEDFYFVYPNNYNEFIRQFNNSFQHGGISLEEMIVPIAIMTPK